MEYRRLGASGLHVSPICLGTMMFGGRTDKKTSHKIIDHARDAGVNFIDTADIYVKGETEKVVGPAVKPHRDYWVLATKAGQKSGEGPNEGGLGAAYLKRRLDGSLKRMGLDHVDIFYFHCDDEDTPIEESLLAVQDLIQAGKTRYYGVSNYKGWRLTRLCSLAASMGLPMPVCAQPYYNAMDRTPERDILPACDYFGLGVVPYSPLARGVLTGKYTPGEEPPKDSRAASGDKRIMISEFRPESMKIAQKIKKHAAKKGMTSGQWAFNWVLANPLVTSVLAGPRTFEHWEGYMSGLEHADKWTEKDEVFMDKMVAPGHPSTPGYSDPKYPFTGRPGA